MWGLSPAARGAQIIGIRECENEEDNKMMYVFSSFFLQCFTRLEDKKDAGKLRQRSSGHQLSPVVWAGL